MSDTPKRQIGYYWVKVKGDSSNRWRIASFHPTFGWELNGDGNMYDDSEFEVICDTPIEQPQIDRPTDFLT
jgi:hypothetical protein